MTRLWTKEQDQFICDNRDIMSHREMGEKLGKTRNAVIGRSHRLGFDDDKVRAPRSPNRTKRTAKQREETKSQVMKIKRRYDTHRALVATGAGTVLARTSMDERLGGMGWYKEVAAVEIVLDQPDIETRPVTFLDRRSDQCAWPLDGGMCCGMPRYTPEYGKTEYCTGHYRLSVRPHSEYRKPLRRRT